MLSETLKGNLNKIFNFIAVSMGIYHLITAVYPFFSPVEHSDIHLAFALILIYLKVIIKSKNHISFLVGVVLLLMSASATIYVFLNFDFLNDKLGLYTTTGLILGTFLLIVTIDAARRELGIALPILALISILYVRYGYLCPGFFNHAGFEWDRLIPSLSIYFTGVFGTLLDASATFIVLFMLLGGLLDSSGAGKFFIDFALATGGRFRSGPAQAAVISSCLVGSINGSAVANVATTGVFTIPLMKKCGYEPKMAGAVEAVASTGGMIMPPVMGVGAFIMAGITGIPYSTIAFAALIPALLYYSTAAATVSFYAAKHNFRTLEKHEIPKLSNVLRDGWHFLMPIAAIIFALSKGFSVTRSGIYGITTILLVTIVKESLRKWTYIFSKDFFHVIKEGLIIGIRGTIHVAAACAVMGILAHAFVISGLAFKIVFMIKELSEGLHYIAVILTVLVSLFFGMGIPTTATYILVAVIGAPALVELGFPLLAVHLFIYYYCIIANITPPVCAAALMGSRIAKANYLETGMRALRIGIPGLILPIIFLYHPALILQGTISEIVAISLSSFFGLISFAAASEGYLFTATSGVERLILGISSIFLVYPTNNTDVIGYILFFTIALAQFRKFKNKDAEKINQAQERGI